MPDSRTPRRPRFALIIALVITTITAFSGQRTIAAEPESPAASPTRPNIIFLMADDMGYGDPHCYNADSKIPTPHMNRLAREGMRFTDAHTPSSVCTPTRYGVLTGRYCWRSRLKSAVQWGFDHPLIEADRPTVASFLKQHGYATACIGKWHLGLGWTTTDGNTGPWPDRSRQEPHANGWKIDYSKPLTGGPLALGFDRFFGIAASNNMPPYCFISDDRVVGSPDVMKSPLHYGNTKSPMVAGWDDSQYGPSFTEQAIAFLKNHHGRTPERPFFLYFPSQAPHRPCVPPELAQGKSQAGRRGDMVYEFDWTVGQIMHTLEELGQTDNTLLIVTSDNGATPGDPFPKGSGKRNGNGFGEAYGHKSCGDWRGYKAQIWEGGHRVPFLVRWPGQVPAGTVSDELVCLTDLMATTAAILKADLPAGAAPDSVSILPALWNPNPAEPVRASLVMHDYAGRFAVRTGDWKYVAPAGTARPRNSNSDAAPQLFDLKNDPQETTNLLNTHPDRSREMAALLKTIQEK